VDETIGVGKPALTEARVRVRLKNGSELTQAAHGARGYPSNPAGTAELRRKFLACAARVLQAGAAGQLFDQLSTLENGTFSFHFA
jgi:hypothetical protein